MNRGLLSQNILAQLRNLVEDFCVLVYNKKNNSNLGVNFDDKKTAYKRLNETCKPKFLMEFHSYLQSSKSHYTTDFDFLPAFCRTKKQGGLKAYTDDQ